MDIAIRIVVGWIILSIIAAFLFSVVKGAVVPFNFKFNFAFKLDWNSCEIADTTDNEFDSLIDPIEIGYAQDCKTETESETEYLEVNGERMEADLAPLVIDILNETDIPVIDVTTFSHEDDSEIVHFSMPDSAAAEALIDLFIRAMPELREKFANGMVEDESGWWGLDAHSCIEECENCGDEHINVYVLVLVPKLIVDDLTLNVHKYLHPHGIRDIVDA